MDPTMSSAQYQGPVTLQVTQLPQSTSFYLAALQPLGYRFISQVQHQTADATSTAVGLGPENSSRVDVFLSQSSRTASHAAGGKTAHVVFPAVSRPSVREFYAAALNAGGRPVEPPADADQQGLFSTVVCDLDGNRVEACFLDENVARVEAPSSEHDPSITKWATTVAESVNDGSSSASTPPPSTRTKAASKPASSGSAPSSSAAGSRTRPKQSATTTTTTAPSLALPGGKTVVGALFGAAAGAALAYTMMRAQADSRRRDDDFASRMAARDSIKAQAMDHFEHTDRRRESDASRASWREKAHTTTSTRRPPPAAAAAADRDSGYYSISSKRRDSSPDGPRYRTITYDAAPPTAGSGNGNGNGNGSGSSSSSRRRRSSSLSGHGRSPNLLEWQPEQNLSTRSSHRSDHSTVKPAPSRASVSSWRDHKPLALPAPSLARSRTYSHRDRDRDIESSPHGSSRSKSKASHYTYAPTHTSRPPSPPPPPPPASRPRRYSGAGTEPVRTYRSPSSSHRADRGPGYAATLPDGPTYRISSKSRPPPPEPIPREPSRSRSRTYTYAAHDAEPQRAPSSDSRRSVRTAVRTALPPSAAGSARSVRTARYYPLPDSPAASKTSRASRHDSDADPRRYPLPPSSAGSRLTAESLKAHEVPLPKSVAGVLDDMETVVPDDSISCAPVNDGESRRGRRGGSAR